MAARRLLLSLAHPDDESFGSGGLIARYVAEGAEVSYICATNGDVGTIKPEFLQGFNSVAERRLMELDCASAKLGLKHVVKLGYKDSGMMGSETSQDSACLWQAPQAEVTCRVVEVIRELQPQVVITFNKYGGYGHPDHIAIQRATTEAFFLAGNASYLTSGLFPYTPQKLYYTSVPTNVLRVGIAWLRLQGKDPRKMGVNQDIDLQAVLDNVEPAHAHIDIRNYYTVWDEANACHQSQLGGRSMSIPNWLRKLLAPWQSLTRVHPKPAADRIIEHDLFDGVRIETAAAVTA